MLEGFDVPPHTRHHRRPHLVEHLELLARLDEREEHAELRAAEALEEAAEDVVVVEEVLARTHLEVLEGLLELDEGVVEHL